MQKIIYLLFVVIFFGVAVTSFGQIVMDGDSTDWAEYPVITAAMNNEENMFPAEVGAAITDIVDIKYVKATVIGNVLYGYIEFWGGPVWPNGAYVTDVCPPRHFESRGYYRLQLDIDNDMHTGWNTAFYEIHYTTVGYLSSITCCGYDPLGAEIVIEWYGRMNDDWHLGNEGVDAINELNYRGIDFEEYKGEIDSGSTHLIFNMAVSDPDSAQVMQREGSLIIDSSDDEQLRNDTLTSYMSGHAWGNRFLEFKIELTPFQKYYLHKDGRSILNPGDTIAISAWVETSYDGWGNDMTPKGEVILPFDEQVNSGTIQLDGKDTDWQTVPTLIIAPNNADSPFQIPVPMATSDIVDIREVKVLKNEDTLYVCLHMWSGPVWPNNADEKEFNDGENYYKSQGYYNICLDLDNNKNTGWDTRYYNNNLSVLGYYLEQGAQSFNYIGCETMIGIGIEYNYPVKNDSSGGVVPYGGVKEITYYANGYEGDSTYTNEINIYRMELNNPDSIKGMAWNGKLPITSSDDPLLVNSSQTYFAGHAWANSANPYEDDFVEFAFPLKPIKEFWARKGKNYLNTNQTIGIAAFVETPKDGWTNCMTHDMTTRGEITVLTSLPRKENKISTKYKLYQNYPNPFNPSTTLSYYLQSASIVQIEIYDVMGRIIKTFTSNLQERGFHNVVWDGTNSNGVRVSTGIYIHKFEAISFASKERFVKYQKITLIK